MWVNTDMKGGAHSAVAPKLQGVMASKQQGRIQSLARPLCCPAADAAVATAWVCVAAAHRVSIDGSCLLYTV